MENTETTQVNQSTTENKVSYKDYSEPKLITRRERRKYLKDNKFLRMKGKLPFSKWAELVAHNIQQGNTIHSNNENRWIDSMHNQLSTRENNIRESFKERGKTQEEIDTYVKEWYDTIFKNVI